MSPDEWLCLFIYKRREILIFAEAFHKSMLIYLKEFEIPIEIRDYSNMK